jgi:hypothetical protein
VDGKNSGIMLQRFRHIIFCSTRCEYRFSFQLAFVAHFFEAHLFSLNFHQSILKKLLPLLP